VCVARFLTLRHEKGLRGFNNRVLRRIFIPERVEVTCLWRKFLNEDLHKFYSLPDIVSVIKSRRM
jgi:hypothetical protein